MEAGTGPDFQLDLGGHRDRLSAGWVLAQSQTLSWMGAGTEPDSTGWRLAQDQTLSWIEVGTEPDFKLDEWMLAQSQTFSWI